MFILDKPYVSDFLKESIAKYQIPVLKTPYSLSLGLNSGTQFIEEQTIINSFKKGEAPFLYTNSENAIGWISQNLGFTSLPGKIDLFKDKVKFRELLQTMDPNFFFREVKFKELDLIKLSELPSSFVIKPAVGFFSHGVYKVEEYSQWETVKENIKKDVRQIRNAYPSEVLDTERFLIEEIVQGTEFAFDVYYNESGKPILLSLLKHLFSSGADVSDRVYISSKYIIEKYLDLFTSYMEKLGELVDLKNFPMHVEVRLDNEYVIRPIEINPLRTGGWCTTADHTWFSFGFNPYEYLYHGKSPNWKEILKDKDDKIFSNIVLTNSSGYHVDKIKSFNYELLASRFEKTLEIRKANYKEFLIFGFLFAETRIDNFKELEWILHNDLKEFIEV